MFGPEEVVVKIPKKRSERIVDTIEISDSGSDSDDKKKTNNYKRIIRFYNFFLMI